MTYNSKRKITDMAVGAMLMLAYALYANGKHEAEAGNLQFWAGRMLIFIGIGIAAIIVVQILFHIAFAIGVSVKERAQTDENVERIIRASMVEDERDKLIDQKAARVGYACVGIGFVAALVVWVLGGSAVTGLHILFGAFAGSTFAEGVVGVYLNERGVHNG